MSKETKSEKCFLCLIVRTSFVAGLNSPDQMAQMLLYYFNIPEVEKWCICVVNEANASASREVKEEKKTGEASGGDSGSTLAYAQALSRGLAAFGVDAPVREMLYGGTRALNEAHVLNECLVEAKAAFKDSPGWIWLFRVGDLPHKTFCRVPTLHTQHATHQLVRAIRGKPAERQCLSMRFYARTGGPVFWQATVVHSASRLAFFGQCYPLLPDSAEWHTDNLMKDVEVWFLSGQEVRNLDNEAHRDANMRLAAAHEVDTRKLDPAKSCEEYRIRITHEWWLGHLCEAQGNVRAAQLHFAHVCSTFEEHSHWLSKSKADLRTHLEEFVFMSICRMLQGRPAGGDSDHFTRQMSSCVNRLSVHPTRVEFALLILQHMRAHSQIPTCVRELATPMLAILRSHLPTASTNLFVPSAWTHEAYECLWAVAAMNGVNPITADILRQYHDALVAEEKRLTQDCTDEAAMRNSRVYTISNQAGTPTPLAQYILSVQRSMSISFTSAPSLSLPYSPASPSPVLSASSPPMSTAMDKATDAPMMAVSSRSSSSVVRAAAKKQPQRLPPVEEDEPWKASTAEIRRRLPNQRPNKQAQLQHAMDDDTAEKEEGEEGEEEAEEKEFRGAVLGTSRWDAIVEMPRSRLFAAVFTLCFVLYSLFRILFPTVLKVHF